MISDLFPQAQRATAMGIFAMGINLGLLIAYLGGGWMSEHWGGARRLSWSVTRNTHSHWCGSP